MQKNKKPSPAAFLYRNAGSKKGESCIVRFHCDDDIVRFYNWARDYAIQPPNEAFKEIRTLNALEDALRHAQNTNLFVFYDEFPLVVRDVSHALSGLLATVRTHNNCIVIASKVDGIKILPHMKELVNYVYDYPSREEFDQVMDHIRKSRK